MGADYGGIYMKLHGDLSIGMYEMHNNFEVEINKNRAYLCNSFAFKCESGMITKSNPLFRVLPGNEVHVSFSITNFVRYELEVKYNFSVDCMGIDEDITLNFTLDLCELWELPGKIS